MFTDKEQWRRQQAECLLCGKKMQIASLTRHMRTQHTGEGRSDDRYQCTPAVDPNIEGKMFSINWKNLTKNPCPVPKCNVGGTDKSTFYRHFNLMHPTADILIAEDGLLPKCELCGFRTKDLDRHRQSKTCLQAQRRRQNKKKQD